jgi:hypothetical protein
MSRICFWLAGVWKQLLLLAHIIVRKSCNLPVFLAVQLWKCYVFLTFTKQNSGRISHLEVLGHLAQHDIIRIIFNILGVVDNVGPNSPHAMGWGPLNIPFERGLTSRQEYNFMSSLKSKEVILPSHPSQPNHTKHWQALGDHACSKLYI